MEDAPTVDFMEYFSRVVLTLASSLDVRLGVGSRVANGPIGTAIDHVVSLRVVLADDRILVARDLRVDGPDWDDAVRIAPALERVRRAIEEHADPIFASRRAIRKHSCGYQLVRIVEALRRGVFPVAELFVGSEGTLGVVTEVTLRVIPVPPERITVLLYLDRFQELGPLVTDLLRLGCQ